MNLAKLPDLVVTRLTLALGKRLPCLDLLETVRHAQSFSYGRCFASFPSREILYSLQEVSRALIAINSINASVMIL